MKEIKHDEWMGMVKQLNAGQPRLIDLINRQAEAALLNPLEITAENPFEPMEAIEDEYDPMDAMEEAYNNRPCFMDELERGE